MSTPATRGTSVCQNKPAFSFLNVPDTALYQVLTAKKQRLLPGFERRVSLISACCPDLSFVESAQLRVAGSDERGNLLCVLPFDIELPQ